MKIKKLTILIILLSSKLFAQEFDPQIVSVSVDTTLPTNRGRVIIKYLPTDHHAVDYFKLYHYVGENIHDLGYVLDKSKNVFTYSEAQADIHKEGFSLSSVSKDSNFDDGIPIAPHFTMFLRADDYIVCEQILKLNWSAYIGWGSNLKEYKIFYKKDNEPYKFKANVDHQTTKYPFGRTDYGSKYKFYIVAENKNGEKSMSNIIEYTVPLKDTMNTKFFYADSVTYDGKQVTISVNTDLDAKLTGYGLLRAKQNKKFEEIAFLEKTNKQRIIFNDYISNVEQTIFYKIAATDFCEDTLAYTNTVKLPMINSSRQGNNIVLSWDNTFVNFNEAYGIFLSVNNSKFEIIEHGVTDKEKQYDLIKMNNSSGETYCFKIGGYTTEGYISQYNKICFNLIPDIKMPNAFTPNNDGMNDEIRPIIKYADIQKYEFIVYNQVGGIVFKSDDYEYAWNGKQGNNRLKEGAYTYYLNFVTYSGNKYRKTGVINLIYP